MIGGNVVTIASTRAHRCREEATLLDTYLDALSHEASVTRAARSGQATARELTAARSQLIAAQGRYWAHVQRHGCGPT